MNRPPVRWLLLATLALACQWGGDRSPRARWAKREVEAHPAMRTPKGYRRWDWLLKQRFGGAQKLDADQLWRTLQELQGHPPALLQVVGSEMWTSLGPAPTEYGVRISGRVVDIAVDPTNPQHWLVAPDKGGLWQTVDGGGTWAPLNDQADSLVMGAVAFAPSNPQIIYAATGDVGVGGLMKSTDGGRTFTTYARDVFARGPGRTEASDIKVHPQNPLVLVASVDNWNGGLYKSIDGGQTWSPRKIPENNPASDLEVADDFNLQYAALGFDGIYRSTNAGDTWTKVAGPWDGLAGGRIEMALSPTNRDVLYVFTEKNGAEPLGVWKSTNAWSATPTFTALPLPPQNLLELLVDRANPSVFYAGGFYRMLRFDGSSWLQIGAGTHADLWTYAYAGSRLIAGNDGGVFSSADGGNSWVSHNSGLDITEFYRGAAHPGTAGFLLAGAQDNGTQVRRHGTSAWDQIGGADGMTTIFSALAPDQRWVSSWQGGQVVRTMHGDAAGVTVSPPDLTGAWWVSPLKKCPTSDEVFIEGTDNLWRTNDFFASYPSAPTWQVNGPEMNKEISAAAFAPGGCQRYAFATLDGRLRLTSDGGQSWTDLDPAGRLAGLTINDLEFDPGNADVVYAALAGFDEPGHPPGHLLRTENASASNPTWTDVSPPSSNLPFYALTLEGSQILYVGTELGVFRSQDRGASWAHLGPETGMPNVPVLDIAVNPATGDRIAFTYGRGALRLEPAVAPPAPAGLSAGGGYNQIALQWTASPGANRYEVKRSSGPGGPYTVVGTPNVPAYVNTGLADSTRYYYVVTAVNPAGQNQSAEISALTGPAPAFQQSTASTGLVAMEAESTTDRIARGGRSWIDVTPSGASGGHALQAMPSNGGNIDTGFATTSPALAYRVNFVKTGVHHVWIRGRGPTTSDDSVHVGLDNQAVSTSDRINGFPNSLTWSKSTIDGPVATFTVPSVGLHTVNVWMREDGFIFDRIVLTSSSSYTPTGTGPAESARGGLSVAITAPAAGSTVSGMVTVTADAQDPLGVSRVEFTLPTGDPIIDTTPPFSVSWDSRPYTGGLAFFKAVAYNPGENSASHEISVNVSNPDTTPPMVTLITPPEGAIVSGNVTLQSNASDNIGVVARNYRVDGVDLLPEPSCLDPCIQSWNSTTVANGTHLLAVTARDAAGNRGVSAPVQVTVSNAGGMPPPPPSGLAITAGSGQTMLSWNAVTGASSYRVKRGPSGTGPFTTVGSPTLNRFIDAPLTNGTHYFYVVSSFNGNGEGADSAPVDTVPTTAACKTAVGGASGAGAWVNATFPLQSGSFGAEYDATPSALALDGLVGLSRGAQTAFTGFATLTRFNTSNQIDARNGSAYAASTTVAYSAGSRYHFRLQVDVAAHRYSIFVTPPGGSEQTLGSNFAFRTEQAGVTGLDTWGAIVNKAGATLTNTACNFWVYP